MSVDGCKPVKGLILIPNDVQELARIFGRILTIALRPHGGGRKVPCLSGYLAFRVISFSLSEEPRTSSFKVRHGPNER